MVGGELYDVIVIGGGYWGSGIAIELMLRGKSVLVLDSNDPMSGTRAASGICDPKAYSSKIFSKLLPNRWTRSSVISESLDWLVKMGGFPVKEKFWNRFAGTDPREGADCIYVDSPETLTNKIKHLVQKSTVINGYLERGVWQILVEERSTPYAAKKLVIAAGYQSGRVAASCGFSNVLHVDKLYGRGLLVSGLPTTELPCSVMIRPYCKHTVRTWQGRDDLFKVGDTAELCPKENSLAALMKVGTHCLTGMKVVSISEGYRPVTDKFVVEKLSSNCVVATGGHRVALGLTGLVAKETLEMLR